MKTFFYNHKYIILLIIISLVLLFPMYRDFYLSHDGEAHVARFAAYYSAFRDGQFPPRWAGSLNSGYGSSLFIFFYPLPGYIACLLHLLSIDFETIYKIMMVFCFLLSPIFLFIWLQSFAKKEIAFVTALAYMVLPYRFLDTFVRGDVAEMLSFVFVPLVFLFIDKVQKGNNRSAIIYGGIFYALLICSHNAIALIFTPVFLGYAIFNVKKVKDIVPVLGIFLIGILLSAFFWMPSITDGKYVYSNILVTNVYKTNFVSLEKLFYSPWGFGPEVNQKGGLSAQIGILYSIISLIALGMLFKIKRRKEIIFWLLVFLTAAFMTTPYSRFLWEHLPLIKLMGYPWRFTSVSGFAACMLLFYLLHYINKKYFIVIVLLLVLFSIPFIKVKGYVAHKPDNFYYGYLGTTDYHMRTMTVWVAGDFWQKAKQQAEIISGQGEITTIEKKSNIHIFKTISKSNIVVVDNTVYFPGWRVYVDGVFTTIQFQDINHRGLITFPVPAGKHTVVVRFTETHDRLAADMVSVVTFVILMFGILIPLWKGKFFRFRTKSGMTV